MQNPSWCPASSGHHEGFCKSLYWLVRSMASVPDPELSGALRYVFKLVGAMIDAEVKTSRGRIDAVIKTAC